MHRLRQPAKRGVGLRGQRTGKPRTRLSAVFSQQPAINWLAVARLFLFGSRDAWFAVALPLFLVASWGWGSTAVGALLPAKK